MMTIEVRRLLSQSQGTNFYTPIIHHCSFTLTLKTPSDRKRYVRSFFFLLFGLKSVMVRVVQSLPYGCGQGDNEGNSGVVDRE